MCVCVCRVGRRQGLRAALGGVRPHGPQIKATVPRNDPCGPAPEHTHTHVNPRSACSNNKVRVGTSTRTRTWEFKSLTGGCGVGHAAPHEHTVRDEHEGNEHESCGGSHAYTQHTKQHTREGGGGGGGALEALERWSRLDKYKESMRGESPGGGHRVGGGKASSLSVVLLAERPGERPGAPAHDRRTLDRH